MGGVGAPGTRKHRHGVGLEFRVACAWLTLIAAANGSGTGPNSTTATPAGAVTTTLLPSTTQAVEIHCAPYTGCDNSRACPSCALGPASACEPAPGESGAACGCSVHRDLPTCDFGDYCYQRCLNDDVDYVFAVNAHPPTTTSTTSTATTSTITTRPGPTITATETTTTTATSTATQTTATTTQTSTQTTTTALDLATLTGTQLRDMARLGEDKIVRLLLASNGTNYTLRTDVAIIVAKLVDISALTTNASASLDVPGQAISISVPQAILQVVGGNVVMTVAALDQSFIGSFEPTEMGKPLAIPPVSVRLRSATTLQDADFGSSMPGEILIEMLSTTPAEARCGYWDETKLKWSSAGLTRVIGANGNFGCATTHLTIFAAILGEFERVIVCSNARIFSDLGIRAIAKGHWWFRAPAWILWIILATQLVLLGWAAFNDFWTYYKAIWRDVDFLTTNEAFQGREIGCLEWIREYISRYTSGGDDADVENTTGGKRRGRCRDVCDSITVTITADCAAYQVARQEKIAPEDLRDIVLTAPGALEMEEQLARSRPPPACSQCATPYAEGERFCPSCGHRREVLGVTLEDSWKVLKSSMTRQAHGLAETMRTQRVPEAVDGLRSNFCFRLWNMFRALHPWVQLRQFSITLGASVRALLLTGKLLGALAMCSLFFNNYGNSLSQGAPVECQRAGFWQHFWRNVAVGFVSATLSLVPLIVITCFSNRRFIYQQTWNKELKRSFVQCWRLQDALLVSMCLIYCGVCILYSMAFLANIDPSAEADWIVSAIVVLFREMILVPLGMAAVYAVVATCVIRARPDLNDSVHHRVENFVGLAAPPEEDDVFLSEQVTLTEGPEEAHSEHGSWADRVGTLPGPEAHMQGPQDALEALGEDDIPMPPLGDLEVDDASRGDPETPSKATLDLLPHRMPDEEVPEKEVPPPPPPPCNKCGSRMWAAFQSEICPMCGHLLPLKPK